MASQSTPPPAAASGKDAITVYSREVVQLLPSAKSEPQAFCERLSALVFNNPVAKHVAGQRGAIAAVVSALRRGSSDAELCVHAVKALRNVTFKNAENAQVSGSLGAVAAVQSALAAHPGNGPLADEAVWLLCQLASSSSNCSASVHRSGVVAELDARLGAELAGKAPKARAQLVFLKQAAEETAAT